MSLTSHRIDLLSPREREVLACAASGMLDKEIGRELGISLNTLKTYWCRIREKVGDVPRTALAVAFTSETGRPVLEPGQDDDFDYHYSVDLLTDLVYASDAVNRLFNLPTGQAYPFSYYKARLHPEDLAPLEEEWNRHINGDACEFHLAGRAVRPTGVTLVTLQVRVYRSADGKAVKAFCKQLEPSYNDALFDTKVEIGLASIDPVAKTFWADDACCSFFEIPVDRRWDLSAFLSRVEPTHVDRVRERTMRYFECEPVLRPDNFLIHLSNGETRWIRAYPGLKEDEDIPSPTTCVILAFK